MRDQDGWLLRYPLESLSSCEERPLKLPIETAIALAGETREESLQIAELLLRDHKPSEFPDEPPKCSRLPPKFACAATLRSEGGGEIALRIRAPVAGSGASRPGCQRGGGGDRPLNSLFLHKKSLSPSAETFKHHRAQ